MLKAQFTIDYFLNVTSLDSRTATESSNLGIVCRLIGLAFAFAIRYRVSISS